LPRLVLSGTKALLSPGVTILHVSTKLKGVVYSGNYQL